MNKIVIALFLIFFTTSLSAAFEYHGFKSGMPKEKADEMLGQSSYSCNILCVQDYFSKLGREKPPALAQLSFESTSDEKLWRIQLDFIDQGTGPYAIAQTRALKNLYPDAELQRRKESSFKYVTALLIDSRLAEADAKKIYNERIDKY